MGDLDNYIERLQMAFARTMRQIGPELNDNEYGITTPQFFILNFLSQKDKCMASELANRMQVKPSAITSMMDRLYKNGFVKRFRDEADRRVVYLCLSEEGKEALENVRKKRKEVSKRYLGLLEEDELNNLVQTFEKLSITVSQNLKRKGEDANE
jgi:MarR family transcriptional regulator, organic hydroperoxide resistance regulator